MKTRTKLTIATAVAVACSALLAAVNLDDAAKKHIQAMREDGTITNVVEMLVKDRTFCSIRGHTWGQHAHLTLEYDPSRISCRECKLCGQHQTQRASAWE